MYKGITHAEVMERLKYIKETGALVWNKPLSNRCKKGTEAGWGCARGHREVAIRNARFKTHRLVWFYVTGEVPTQEIDHINQDPSDNRFENLREVDRTTNARNCPKQKNNKSGHTGVTWFKPASLWQAVIWHKSKMVHLGYYKNKTDAINAREKGKVQYGYHQNHGN